MKVHIGPHKSWFGPYQLADLLQYVGVSEDRCFEIGRKLNKTWIRGFAEWLHTFKKRKVKIKIHSYDVWNMDSTLAMIILPMLIELKKCKHGFGFVEDADVPEELRSTNAKPLTDDEKNSGLWDNSASPRYDWLMDELIWTFTQLNDENSDAQFWGPEPERTEDEDIDTWIKRDRKVDWDGLRAHDARIKNGLRLFGTYYQTLWD